MLNTVCVKVAPVISERSSSGQIRNIRCFEQTEADQERKTTINRELEVRIQAANS